MNYNKPKPWYQAQGNEVLVVAKLALLNIWQQN